MQDSYRQKFEWKKIGTRENIFSDFCHVKMQKVKH